MIINSRKRTRITSWKNNNKKWSEISSKNIIKVTRSSGWKWAEGSRSPGWKKNNTKTIRNPRYKTRILGKKTIPDSFFISNFILVQLSLRFCNCSANRQPQNEQNVLTIFSHLRLKLAKVVCNYNATWILIFGFLLSNSTEFKKSEKWSSPHV